MVAFSEGVWSAAFAIALVFTVITIRDAFGFRYEIGVHGKILNRLVSELPPNEAKTYPKLSERWGHTPAEIAVGTALGVLIGVVASQF